LESVPTGGDIYCIARVLFNWTDADALTILRNCRRSMTASARLLIIENLLPSRDHPGFARLALNSLHLWLMFGSRQRSFDEYGDLLREAGFGAPKRVDIPESIWSVLDAEPS
jgi:hypothetical protein